MFVSVFLFHQMLGLNFVFFCVCVSFSGWTQMLSTILRVSVPRAHMYAHRQY